VEGAIGMLIATIIFLCLADKESRKRGIIGGIMFAVLMALAKNTLPANEFPLIYFIPFIVTIYYLFRKSKTSGGEYVGGGTSSSSSYRISPDEMSKRKLNYDMNTAESVNKIRQEQGEQAANEYLCRRQGHEWRVIGENKEHSYWDYKCSRCGSERIEWFND
jgi:hypothetical protein